MAKGEIVIDEMYCRGCGYCADFCPQKCIVLSGDRFTTQGYALAHLAHPEDCNACKVCGLL
jgi:2-oxoglutarate ferredoxin oxidoreductase subunit delta